MPQSSEPGAAYDTSIICQNTRWLVCRATAGDGVRLPRQHSDRHDGSQGTWDFVLRWTPRGQPGAADSSTISLFDALDEQLGLKVETQKISMDVVVADRVNRIPSDNPPGTTQKFPPVPSNSK